MNSRKNMLHLFFLCAILIVTSLHANVEKHLKKIADKAGSHKIENIDFIYVINLDQRPEKYASCLEQFRPWGIEPYRFSAVSGWDLSVETINELGVVFTEEMMSGVWGTYYPLDGGGQSADEIVHVLGRNYFSHRMKKGPIGIVLSHLSVLQDAYDSGYETIWVMEDDIECIQNPHLLSSLISELDALVGEDGWDILFTDRDTKNREGVNIPCYSYAWRPNFIPADPLRFAQRPNVGSHFRCIGARYGAYSMIVRRSGMQKILDFFKEYQIFLPYDMEYTLPDDIRLFTVLEDVVSTQIKALSDNGAPNYRNKDTE